MLRDTSGLLYASDQKEVWDLPLKGLLPCLRGTLPINIGFRIEVRSAENCSDVHGQLCLESAPAKL